MPELRKDPVLGRWVIIDTQRVRRPGDYHTPRPARRPAPCPLCEGHEHETPPEVMAYRNGPDALPDTPGWRVRVVPSKFPALRAAGELERRGHGLYDVVSGHGVHEIIVESPNHDVSLAALPVEAVEEVLRAYRDRIAALKRDPRFRAVAVFRTHGAETGAHMAHPHSQLLATPILPETVGEELLNARAYHDYRERCLFCDIAQQEADESTRVVLASERIIAFTPFASRVPFETWILPRRHAPAFERAPGEEIGELAQVLRRLLRRLDRTLHDPPFHLALHTAPFADADSSYYHWHLELLPRLAPRTTMDMASGLPVNPVPPEDAARFLREAGD